MVVRLTMVDLISFAGSSVTVKSAGLCGAAKVWAVLCGAAKVGAGSFGTSKIVGEVVCTSLTTMTALRGVAGSSGLR